MSRFDKRDMEYFAHTNDNGCRQPLKEHLEGVAGYARDFSVPGLKSCAYLAGLTHDIGKYSREFQARLSGSCIAVDHSTYGAQVVCDKFGNSVLGMLFAYVVAGHHSGLPDKGNKGENADETSLRARLKKSCADAGAWRAELSFETEKAMQEMIALNERGLGRSEYEFLVRYLYSCLVDADFIDTETFVSGGNIRPHINVDWLKCKVRLDELLSGFEAKTELQKARQSLQRQAMEHIGDGSGIYSLDMPTGSGKTLCALSLALERLLRGGKKRIIFVIPYTGIVEQTARVLRGVFPDTAILEHHCNFDFNEIAEEKLNGWTAATAENADHDARSILKRSAENWDAPIVVTTNVQFFESIYSNRSSKMRKLHNIAESVIVFDEIHTMPVPYFIPCMKAIGEFVKLFGSEALFLTATMPDFPRLTQKFMGEALDVKELIHDKSEYRKFDKCTFEFQAETAPTCFAAEGSTLVVVNRKKTAEALYSECTAKKKFCLSTYLTPADRERKIAQIRSALAQGESITVFATSLIEAGVDLDFDRVYRELSGVDSILQAAGRCNREGKRARRDSVVTVFTLPSELGGTASDERASIARGLIQEYGVERIADEACVKRYFELLYGLREYTMHGLDKRKDWDIDFKTIASDFHLIDSMQIGVVIPCPATADALAAPELPIHTKRKLQRNSASVTFYELKSLIECGAVTERDGVFVLADESMYSSETGLKTTVLRGNCEFF